VNDPATVLTAQLRLIPDGPLTLDTTMLDARDVDSDRSDVEFQVVMVSGGYFEHVDAQGVETRSLTLDELASRQLRFVPTGGDVQIVLRTWDGQTEGTPVAVRIDVPTLDLVLQPGKPEPASPAAPAPASTPPPQVAEEETSPITAPPMRGSVEPGPASAEPPTPTLATWKLAPPAAAAAAEYPASRPVVDDPSGAERPLSFEAMLDDSSMPRLQAALPGIRATLMDSIGSRTPDEEEIHLQQRAQRHALAVNTVEVGGAALTAGIVWWMLRSAGLLSSLLASWPAWRHVDPLPVLGAQPEEGGAEPLPDEEAAEEHAAGEVLAGATEMRARGRS
jgi:hypothetical protein